MEQNILEQIIEGSMKPTNIPLETLHKITDGFSTDRIIGEGGFGTVYKGVVGNNIVAVKRIRSSMTIDQKLFRREVDSLMEVNHQNVVSFFGFCSHTVETPIKNPESRGYIYAEIRERLLCFEYISNGSLDTKLTDELRGLEWDKRYQIIKGICAGLHYLHMEKHILHMDLKPANVLLHGEMVPKITDFGLSRPTEYSQTMSTNHFSSPGYGAPENLFGRGRMSVKSDIYSLGVIIIELVTGHKGIPDSNNILRRWRHRWNKSAKETPLEYHQQVIKCIEIGSLCQKIDPYARPSISEIMSQFVEMERMNNHSRNADESTVDHIYPHYSDDDMLGVEPLELQFGHDESKQILSCSVELSNSTDGFIAFKIQTTSPFPYSIDPNTDIVKPRSKCSVAITMPAAIIHGNKVALQYSTNKRYTEEFVVRSIKVNEVLTTNDINEDMFDKHTAGKHVDEIHLAVASEETCSKEVIDFPSKQAKKQYASSGIPLECGRVQLVIKSDKWAPCQEYKKKVMLELTGGALSTGRLGLDLVAVVDTSGSMLGEKIDQLKTAMRFIVRKLSPIDRLSIVTFSNSATKLCPLRQITKASQQELEELINGLQANGGTNILHGLQTGLKVLAGRKVSGGRVVGIMLMSDGQQFKGDAAQLSIGNVPVFTFGFSEDSDPMVLSTIAANSMGGTFSHIKDIGGGGLTMAFSQCLAGLLTVAVQDLELTVTAVRDESTLVEVTAGNYPQRHDDSSVIVSFGDLYSWEVRSIIVDLLLPAIDNEHSAEILKVTYSYRSSSSSAGRLQFVAPPEKLTVWRNSMEVSEEEKPVEMQMEEARLRVTRMIKEVRTVVGKPSWIPRYTFTQAQHKVAEAQQYVLEKCDPLLRIELLELSELCRTEETYEQHGIRYAFSSESSHDRQRFAMRGRGFQTVRLFATPRMDEYLEQAKKFHKDPTMPLPSVDDDDDDVEEGGSALTVDVSSREEEMQRLSLDVED